MACFFLGDTHANQNTDEPSGSSSDAGPDRGSAGDHANRFGQGTAGQNSADSRDRQRANGNQVASYTAEDAATECARQGAFGATCSV